MGIYFQLEGSPVPMCHPIIQPIAEVRIVLNIASTKEEDPWELFKDDHISKPRLEPKEGNNYNLVSGLVFL